MRSGKIIAINDFYIEQLINDPDYRIYEDGSIYTLIQTTGKRSTKNAWRRLIPEITVQGYVRIKYRNKKLSLHRTIYRKFIGYLSIDLTINHKDHNRDNNNVSNLELVTSKNNSRARNKTSKKTSSIYKGVSRTNSLEKWRALIYVNYKKIHLGLFVDEIEAAKAYNKAAIKYFGKFAVLNEV